MERNAMNATRFSRIRSVRYASVVALTALTLLAPAMAAQDADGPHPAHIHTGTCEELGDVVLPLTDIAAPAADAARSGPESAVPVKHSETRVDVPLQEIIDGGHAVNVHLSAEEIGEYIACGDIGGALMMDEGDQEAELVIGLRELNGSGHTGIVWFGAEGDATLVSVSLIEPGDMSAAGAEAAQEASPAATDASADETAVTIQGFAFDPPAIDVPVGGSVTWTNQDNVPHTATGLDREALQSGAIAFDQSFTQTFDTAGTYEYFCEFHPNMEGSIVVE